MNRIPGLITGVTANIEGCSKSSAHLLSRAASRFDVLSKGLVRERGKMNKSETAYSELLTADPDVYRWWFEPFTVRLSHPPEGQPATYTPDFLVLMSDGTTYVDDVKAPGKWDDKAGIVRLKCASELFPLWTWRIARRQRKSEGGGFELEEV